MKLNKIERTLIKLSSHWFIFNSKELLINYGLGKLSLEQTEEYLNKMKKLLSIEALKELKLPKENLTQTLSLQYLHEKLEQEVPNKNIKIKRLKI